MRIFKKLTAAPVPVFLFVWLLFLILARSVPDVRAQDGAAAYDPYPLRPADTSSPRDTLRSLKASVVEAYQAFLSGEPEGVIARSAQRAGETLDFSQLPERG